MFNLQQKYKKNISQDAKPGNKFIGDTTALPRTEREGTARNRKVIWAGHTERKEWALPGSAGSVPQAYSPWLLCPPCLGAPFGLGR